jgi:L-asparaginase
MRPSTATSADGPANLLEAVTVAVDPRAKGRGALIVLNDRIGQAWYTIKRNANTLETFGAPEQGFVGGLLSYTPFWYYPPTQPTFKKTFSSANVSALPPVEIIYAHESYDPRLIPSAITLGAKGIVIAGTGAGDESSAADPYIAAAVAAGVPVVVSTKINVGCVVPSKGSDSIAAGFLNPVKSRIQLQFALANGMSMNETRAAFEEVLGSMIGYGASG